MTLVETEDTTNRQLTAISEYQIAAHCYCYEVAGPFYTTNSPKIRRHCAFQATEHVGNKPPNRLCRDRANEPRRFRP